MRKIEKKLEELKAIMIGIGQEEPADEAVRQAALNLTGLFHLLSQLDKQTQSPMGGANEQEKQSEDD